MFLVSFVDYDGAFVQIYHLSEEAANLEYEYFNWFDVEYLKLQYVTNI